MNLLAMMSLQVFICCLKNIIASGTIANVVCFNTLVKIDRFSADTATPEAFLSKNKNAISEETIGPSDAIPTIPNNSLLSALFVLFEIPAEIASKNGAVITLVTSFDVVAHTMPNIELYGTEGSMKVPDPNMFGGSVQLATRQERQFAEIPLVSRYSENSRGIGISEMILAINENRTNNASGELALHVLEIMEAFLKSAESGAPVFIESVPSPEIALDWNVEIGELKTRN